MTDDDSPVFERGDVVFGADPFKGGVVARPWLVVSNHEGRAFHGEQYIALTLTTRSWMDGLVPIPEARWLEGGTPVESRVVPWGVQSLHRDDIEHWQGRLDQSVVDEAVTLLVEELEQEQEST